MSLKFLKGSALVVQIVGSNPALVNSNNGPLTVTINKFLCLPYVKEEKDVYFQLKRKIYKKKNAAGMNILNSLISLMIFYSYFS